MYLDRVPYMAKLSIRKTFMVFQPIVEVFPLNHLLYTLHEVHGLMHRKSFPVTSVFCAQPQKIRYGVLLHSHSSSLTE